jgi:hypothetical protein
MGFANVFHLQSKHKQASKLVRNNIAYCQVLEWSSILDIGQGSVECLQLDVNLCSCSLSFRHLYFQSVQIIPPSRFLETNSLCLEFVNGFNMCRHIIRRRLKPLQQLFSICDNVLVLEDGAVVLKVDRGRLLRQCTMDALGIRMALSERLKG